MSKTDLTHDTSYQVRLNHVFIFEMMSLLGRIFMNSKPKLQQDNKPNLLNLGCAADKFDGWINADFFQGFQFWKPHPYKPNWMLDIRYPLNCNDNTWDGVFCEHTIEHIYPNQDLALFKELYRTMKHNAYLRITVPDLEKYIQFYTNQYEDENFKQWDTRCEAVRSLTQNYFHLSLWDYELLEKYLRAAGFKNIKKMNYMESSDPRLLKDNKDRKWETLYVEAQKLD